MRPGQKNNRSRGRGNGGGGGGRKNVNPLSRSYESNGPDVKVRGNPATIAEKYVQLARDAQASGDSVMAENYFQHAEHYFRIISAAQAQTQARQEERDRAQAERGENVPEHNRADNRNVNNDQAKSDSDSDSDDEDDSVASNASEPVAQEAGSDGEEETPRPRRAPRARRPRRKPVENGELAEAPQPSMNLADPQPATIVPVKSEEPKVKAPSRRTKDDDGAAKEAAE